MTNPWNTGSVAQRKWLAKWSSEHKVCHEICSMKAGCTALHRMDNTICLLLQAKCEDYMNSLVTNNNKTI